MVMIETPTSRERTIRWEDPTEARKATVALTGREWLEGIRDGTIALPPAAAMLDLRIEDVEDGRVVFSMPPSEMQYNPAGTVHGGVLTTLADTAMTTAIISQLPAGSWAPTIELKINFIRPVTEQTGRILAAGRAIHVGHGVAVAEADITDDAGRLYAHATSTCAVKRGAE